MSENTPGIFVGFCQSSDDSYAFAVSTDVVDLLNATTLEARLIDADAHKHRSGDDEGPFPQTWFPSLFWYPFDADGRVPVYGQWTDELRHTHVGLLPAATPTPWTQEKICELEKLTRENPDIRIPDLTHRPTLADQLSARPALATPTLYASVTLTVREEGHGARLTGVHETKGDAVCRAKKTRDGVPFVARIPLADLALSGHETGGDSWSGRLDLGAAWNLTPEENTEGFGRVWTAATPGRVRLDQLVAELDAGLQS
jgi:hypothetical protein